MKKFFLFLFIILSSLFSITTASAQQSKSKAKSVISTQPILSTPQKQKVDTSLVQIKIIYDLYKSKSIFQNFVFYPEHGIKVQVRVNENNGNISVFFDQKVDSISTVKILGKVNVVDFLNQQKIHEELISSIENHFILKEQSNEIADELIFSYTSFDFFSNSDLKDLLGMLDLQAVKKIKEQKDKLREKEIAYEETLRCIELQAENEFLTNSWWGKRKQKKFLKKIGF